MVPQIALEPGHLDFGEVPIGAVKRLDVLVSNPGDAPLEITGLDAMGPFRVAGSERVVVPPSAQERIEVAYTPREEDGDSGSLVVSSNAEAAPTLTVQLRGRAVPGFISSQPAELDLTGTPVGTVRTGEVIFGNLGLEPVEGLLRGRAFARPEHFTLGGLPIAAEQAVALQPRSELALEVAYRPFAAGVDPGRLVLEVCGDRCGIEVPVLGAASDSVVRLDPPLLDFGGLPIGEPRTLQLRVENLGDAALTVTEVGTSGDLGLQATASRALPAAVEGRSSLGVNVELTASAAGEIEGEVVVHTSDPLVPRARVPVRGRGEGPRFSVQPAALSFGVVRRTGEHTRPVLLANAGSSSVRILALEVTGAPELGLAPGPTLPVRLGPGESLVVSATFTPGGEGEYHGALTVHTDDPGGQQVVVPLSGGLADRYCDLESAPSRKSFGLVPPGHLRAQAVRLTNRGEDECALLSAELRAPVDPAFRVLPAAWPTSLRPGESTLLELEYAPQTRSESKGNLVITTGDPVFPERHVVLSGSSLGYTHVFVRPEILDFGVRRPGCGSPTQTLTFFNAGTQAVTLNQVDLAPVGGAFSFSTAVRAPHMVPAGGVARFDVRFDVPSVGREAGEVELTVGGLPHALVVPLRGEGDLTPRAADTFVQRVNDKVDVLFVIDDSCSMLDEQMSLAANITQFIRQATLRSSDFHLGITTTTVFPTPGLLVGPVLNRGTPSLEQQFRAQAAVGTSGSGIEQGLEAMAGAFRAADRGVRPNAELFRSDAATLVVIISDEDDQSPAPPLTYFGLLQSRPAVAVQLALITGQAAGCRSAGGSATPAPRYEEIRALTSGISESICGDWAGTLTRIGAAAFGLRAHFTLSQPADLNDPIEVLVNGAAQPRSAWSYDPATGAVLFATPPPNGATIEIRYTPRC